MTTEPDGPDGPDGVEPDTKDWTWVLHRRCDACGFDPHVVDARVLAERIRASAHGWDRLLAAPVSRERPSPSVWSTAEYGAHVADVGRVMAGRLTRILTEDDPLFENWDQDAAAIDGGYADREGAEIARDLAVSVESLAEVYAGVPDEAWDRPGRRSNGSVFTAATLGVYALHDLEHHRVDVGLDAPPS